MTTDAYKRDDEIENNVQLMKMLYDLALHGYNPKAGPNDATNADFFACFRSKSIMSWSNSCAMPFAASLIFKMRKIAHDLSIGR